MNELNKKQRITIALFCDISFITAVIIAGIKLGIFDLILNVFK